MVETASKGSHTPEGSFRAYLKLMRLPAVFTAMADIFLGFLLTHPTLEPTLSFVLVLICSSCLYLAGMIFNDVFDRKQDAEERPHRPIPSGAIPIQNAVATGGMLILAGLGAANVAGRQSLLTALMLTACIFAYDAFLKRTHLGPLAMGSCRFLNVLLGASTITEQVWTLPHLVHAAAGLGVYITGVTWFARTEAKVSQRSQLVMAMGTINFGFAILVALFIRHETPQDLTASLMLLAVIVLTINRRLSAALMDPVPEKVQPCIKLMLMSHVMLDATIILYFTGNLTLGIATAALLLPSYLLGKFMAMT